MSRTQHDDKTNPSLNSDWPWRIEAVFRFAIDETDGSEAAIAEYFDVHPRTVRRWAERHGFAEEVFGVSE